MSSFPRLSYACPIPWATMRGDEKERFCSKCSRTVVNLSQLTEPERVTLLRNSRPEDLCVSYYRRLSGEFVSAENPLTEPEKRRVVQYGTAALSVGAMAIAISCLPAVNEAVTNGPDKVSAAYFQAKETVLDGADRVAEALTGKPLREPKVVLFGGMMICPPAPPGPAPAPAATAPAPSPTPAEGTAEQSDRM